jgi:primosomal protein N' (replication factor Y)
VIAANFATPKLVLMLTFLPAVYNGYMRYYEVFIADGSYRSDAPLIYASEISLSVASIVTVPLKNRHVTGFILGETQNPSFAVKNVKALLSKTPLPGHCIDLANWVQTYYACNRSEALRQFAPSRPVIQRGSEVFTPEVPNEAKSLKQLLTSPLTKDQVQALKAIRSNPSTTVLLHGDTGTGKTRVYIELAKRTLGTGKSVILLTPEIALTSQLSQVVHESISTPVFVFHSQLGVAERKKIWFAILEASEPVVVIGPRSALFSPLQSPGLIVVDEAHEPAYKQEQSPRYHATRVASQLGFLSGAKVVLGTATPSITDYYLAEQHKSIVRMVQPAIKSQAKPVIYNTVDLRDRNNLSNKPQLSKQLIGAIKTTLLDKKQIMLYLNRRGSARVVMCANCGWQALCPNCDVPLVYHADEHATRCHICNFQKLPPSSCPTCKNDDIIYKSIGTKALADFVAKEFPGYTVQRFDSDNKPDEQINHLYPSLHRGEIDILVGTQLLAKGLDLPKLGLVGILAAESSLSLPDYTAEERTFQLLYQAIGRVGRGHGNGQVVIQSYDPDSVVVKAAVKRDWRTFYKYSLKHRQDFRFPPFSYLLKITCRRSTLKGAQTAASRVKIGLLAQKLPVEIIGPTPSFYGRRARYYYWQLVIKGKQREHLLYLAKQVPSDWVVDLDPVNLL